MEHPINPDVLPESLEGRLEISQRLRAFGMKELTTCKETGEVRLPTSDEDRNMFLKLIDGFDRTTLGTMKAKTDEKKAESDNIVALGLARLATMVPAGAPPLPERIEGHRIPQVDPHRLPDIEVVPGQLDTETHTITYSELASRFAGGRQALAEAEEVSDE
jgi:hypothetical protein